MSNLIKNNFIKKESITKYDHFETKIDYNLFNGMLSPNWFNILLNSRSGNCCGITVHNNFNNSLLLGNKIIYCFLRFDLKYINIFSSITIESLYWKSRQVDKFWVFGIRCGFTRKAIVFLGGQWASSYCQYTWFKQSCDSWVTHIVVDCLLSASFVIEPLL